MKKSKIFALLFLLPICVAAQSDGQLIKFGGSRPQDTAHAARSLRIDSVVRLLKYAASDTNKVLGINAQGIVELRTKSSGTVTDTASLSTRIDERVKYTDTAAMLSTYYRTVTATAALATKQGYSDTNTYDATKKNLADTSALLRTLISGSVSGVSSVSATDGNGFDFTITNPSSTPNILLALQSDHNFVSDAQLVVLGNTSGTNTGDQTTITGNAGTATTLQTARTINGTSFDGSANITVTASASTLTGSTLASGVTASSLTSVGTISSGTWNGTVLSVAYGGTGTASPAIVAGSGVSVSGSFPNQTVAATGFGVSSTTIAKTASYTLTAAENGKVITFNSGSAMNVTVPSGLGSGFNCLIVQLGAGKITFVASSTTISNRQSFTKTAGAYAIATLVAYGTDTFITSGDME